MNDLASAAVERAWLPLVPFGLQLFFGLVALGVLAGTWYSSSGIATPKRLALLSFRAVALSVLAWVVAGPHTVRSEERSVRDPLVVLLDASESMAIEDVEGKTRAAAVGAWLREQETAFADLAEAYDLRWFLVDGGLRPWLGGGSGDGASLRPLGVLREGLFLSGGDVASAFSGDATPSRGKNTDLGLGLLSLRDALDGAVPAGVLLVSDGGDRGALARAQAGGDGRVEALVQELGYPVSTWTVGQPEGPRDQGIRSFEGPPFGFVRRPLKLWAELSSQGLGDGPVVVVLRADGEVVASQEVRWDGESSTTLGFEIKPDQVGFVTYSLDLPLAAEDAIPSNNLAELTVKVLRDRTRVLQLTSHPSWDVKMLRRLLKTDPNVDLVCFFILRGHNGGALARRGPLSLIPFPFDELFFEDLQGFDLVVFHNFSFRSFTQQAVGPFYEAVRS